MHSCLRRLSYTLLFTVSLIFLVYPGIASAASVKSQSASHSSVQIPQHIRSGCHHLMAYLHGNNLPTQKCVDQTSTSGKVAPYTSAVRCSNSALYLDDGSTDQYTLCLIGSGNANMTDFCLPNTPCFLGNWNDLAENYQVGCSSVIFYIDINEKGQSQPAPPHESWSWANYPPISPSGHQVLLDYSLSSIHINSGCTTG